MDKVHKLSDYECYTTSSEPFRFYRTTTVQSVWQTGYTLDYRTTTVQSVWQTGYTLDSYGIKV
jgi:hypothetical protein